jgi:hypothetical protein
MKRPIRRLKDSFTFAHTYFFNYVLSGQCIFMSAYKPVNKILIPLQVFENIHSY